jgi:hypothetical protein
VQGQVYIRSNYRPATTYSGWIQDSSDYGINLFGTTTNSLALQDIGNLVTLTAVVDTYFTTVELVNATNVMLVSSANPPLAPAVLTTGAAANHRYEGTFVEVTGTVSAVATTAGTSPAHNYTANDGSGNIVVRVLDIPGVPIFGIGEQITARGAGGQFNADFQVIVGRLADCFLAGGDTTAPTRSARPRPA